MALNKGNVSGMLCHDQLPCNTSGNGQCLLSNRTSMGFVPIFSAFLCSMGCGLVPRIITQSLLWQTKSTVSPALQMGQNITETPQSLLEPGACCEWQGVHWRWEYSVMDEESSGLRGSAGFGGLGGHSLPAMQLSSSFLCSLSLALWWRPKTLLLSRQNLLVCIMRINPISLSFWGAEACSSEQSWSASSRKAYNRLRWLVHLQFTNHTEKPRKK